MCLRYTLLSPLNVLRDEFHIDVSAIENRYTPDPNIGAGDLGVVITADDPQTAQLFHFGFTPHWARANMDILCARSEGERNKSNDPNYRGAQGILSKPTWRQSIRKRRCIVLANAFILGTTEHDLDRPHLIYKRRDARPFALAGLWDEWINPMTYETLQSFAIITTAATPLISLLPGHRCPMVLAQDNERLWTSENLPLHGITALLHPFDDSAFNAYPISNTIKDRHNKDRALLYPIGEWVRKELNIVVNKRTELEGMGMTTARRRRLRRK